MPAPLCYGCPKHSDDAPEKNARCILQFCDPPGAAATQQHHVRRVLALRCALLIDRVVRQLLLNLIRQLVHHRRGVRRLRAVIQGLHHLLAFSTDVLVPSNAKQRSSDVGQLADRQRMLSAALVRKAFMDVFCQELSTWRGRLSFRGSVPLMASLRPGPRTTTPQRCSVAYRTLTACCGYNGSRSPACGMPTHHESRMPVQHPELSRP